MPQSGGDHTGSGCLDNKIVVKKPATPVPSSPQEECGEVNADVDDKKMV